jgi:hypothetical protein
MKSNKLQIKKVTLRDLDDSQLNVVGGITGTCVETICPHTCATCHPCPPTPAAR